MTGEIDGEPYELRRDGRRRFTLEVRGPNSPQPRRRGEADGWFLSRAPLTSCGGNPLGAPRWICAAMRSRPARSGRDARDGNECCASFQPSYRRRCRRSSGSWCSCSGIARPRAPVQRRLSRADKRRASRPPLPHPLELAPETVRLVRSISRCLLRRSMRRRPPAAGPAWSGIGGTSVRASSSELHRRSGPAPGDRNLCWFHAAGAFSTAAPGLIGLLHVAREAAVKTGRLAEPEWPLSDTSILP